MNEPLSDAAKHALRDSHFVSEPHKCQKFIRQVVQSRYGSLFNRYHLSTARLSGLQWQRSQFAVPLERGSTIGDILYKLTGSGGDGHVGIRISGNRVAENSSVHWNPEDDRPDARGIRTLKEFGNHDLIVRLPLPKMAEILASKR